MINAFRYTLKCSFCGGTSTIQAPDRHHSAYSTTKPPEKAYRDKLILQRNQCEKCRRPFIIYWYAPLDYLTIM